MSILQRLIREAAVEIKKRRTEADNELIFLQADCRHPAATKVHNSNTGNYDRSADAHWTEHKCPDCGKAWTTDGSN